MTRRAFLSLTVLIIYNMGAREKWIKHRSQGCRPKNIIFAHSQKTHENPIDFNISYFHKNKLLEKAHFTFVTRLRRNELSALFLFYVCGGFNIFFLRFASALARVGRAFAENHFVVQKQNISYFPTLVNNSYKTYCRTPVPLLVRFWSHVPSAVARNL